MAISAVSQHGPNPQGGLRRRDRSVSLPVPDAREIAAEMTAGEPGRIGRAHPERQPPPYEPAPPLTEEERKRGKEAIEKIRRDNPNIVNPESTMVPEESMLASIWGAVMDTVPDVDPKTAIMVAAAIAAAVAAGTGVGGPLAPVILGGGAALASQ